MRDINKIIVSGNLTKDPTVSYTSEQMAVAKFTIAINTSDKKTDFPECTAFGKTAEFIEKYFSKGQKINIIGKISTSNYTNKEGNKVYKTEILVEDAGFGEKKAAPSENNDFMDIPDGIEKELPFN